MPDKGSTEELIKQKFLTPVKFAMEIEDLVKNSDGLINYIDAIIVYCDENGLELESVPKLLSKPLKEKIKRDAQYLNFVKRTSRGMLPV